MVPSCSWIGVDIGFICFMLDGERLNMDYERFEPYDTSEQLGLEDGDLMSAVILTPCDQHFGIEQC